MQVVYCPYCWFFVGRLEVSVVLGFFVCPALHHVLWKWDRQGSDTCRIEWIEKWDGTKEYFGVVQREIGPDVWKVVWGKSGWWHSLLGQGTVYGCKCKELLIVWDPQQGVPDMWNERRRDIGTCGVGVCKVCYRQEWDDASGAERTEWRWQEGMMLLLGMCGDTNDKIIEAVKEFSERIWHSRNVNQ